MRLKEIRVSKGWNQKTLADKIGVTVPAYSRYESGEREPDIATLVRIADALNVSLDYLVGRSASSGALDLVGKEMPAPLPSQPEKIEEAFTSKQLDLIRQVVREILKESGSGSANCPSRT